MKQEAADKAGAATLLVLKADRMGRSRMGRGGRGRVGRGSRMGGA